MNKFFVDYTSYSSWELYNAARLSNEFLNYERPVVELRRELMDLMGYYLTRQDVVRIIHLGKYLRDREQSILLRKFRDAAQNGYDFYFCRSVRRGHNYYKQMA